MKVHKYQAKTLLRKWVFPSRMAWPFFPLMKQCAKVAFMSVRTLANVER